MSDGTALTDPASSRGCLACGAAMQPGMTFCDQCGVRRAGPAGVPAAARRRGTIARKLSASAHLKDLRTARLMLMVVGVVSLLYAVFACWQLSSQIDAVRRNPALRLDEDAVHTARLILIANFSIPVVYFGLWLWARRNPFAACLTALVVLVTLWLAAAAIHPLSLVSGIILKIVFIAAMLQGMRSALRYKRFQRSQLAPA